MMDETKPAAQTATEQNDSLIDQAKGALTDAGELIGDAFDDVVDAAKKNPVAAAAIAAGTAAVAAGAAYGISKLINKDGEN